jgi:hypothetical protein
MAIGENMQIFFLTRSVENVERGDFLIDNTLFAV